MRENVRLWDLLKVVKNIATKSILSHKWLRALACAAAASTIVSTYFVVQTAQYSTILVGTFKKHEFAKNLRGFLFVSIASLVFRYVPTFAYTYVMQYIMRREFVALARKYMGLSYEQFQKKTPGELRYLIFLNAYAIPMVTQTLVFEFSRLLGMCFFLGIQAAKTTNVWAVLLFVTLPVALMAAAGAYLRRRLKQQKIYLKEQERISSVLYDKLINYEVIKTYNLEENETNRFYESTNRLANAYKKLGVFDGNWIVLMNCMLAVVLLLLVLAANSGDILLKLLLMYSYMSAQLRTMVEQFIRLMDFAYQIKYTEMGSETNSEIEQESLEQEAIEQEALEQESTNSKETSNLDHKNFNSDHKNFNSDHKKIRFVFNNVSLFYQKELILRNINESIHLGEKIAVVGPNGCGKSTFIKSLMGFVRNTGAIKFGGHVVSSKLAWQHVRKNVAYVPQNHFLLNEPVITNLRFGRRGASEEDVYFQAARFGVHDDIISLPQGYDTLAGPRGNKLSGGQQQKLSLVRAALRDGPIFILDEATAAMDKNYEKFLIDTIWANFIDKTIVMIVHGKNYLHRFNRVFFLNNGRIECTGSYEELLASSENFRRFVAV